MTPTEIEDAARDQYNAIGDTFFSQSSVMTLIYKAQKQLVTKAPVIERTYTTVSVADQREYDYPSSAFALWRVEYDSQPLSKVTFRETDSINGLNSSTSITGTPRFYSIWDETLFLTPTPDTSALEIKLFTHNVPEVVTASSTLDVPLIFHTSIIDFVLSEMFAKDGNSNMALYYRNLWIETLKDAVKYVAKRKRAGTPAHVQTEECLVTNTLGTI
jgi:hypothetical protein